MTGFQAGGVAPQDSQDKETATVCSLATNAETATDRNFLVGSEDLRSAFFGPTTVVLCCPTTLRLLLVVDTSSSDVVASVQMKLGMEP